MTDTIKYSAQLSYVDVQCFFHKHISSIAPLTLLWKKNQLPGVKSLAIVALVAFQQQQFCYILLTSCLTKAKCSVVSDTMYSCTVKTALGDQ